MPITGYQQDEIDKLIAAKNQQQRKYMDEYRKAEKEAKRKQDRGGWAKGALKGASLGAIFAPLTAGMSIPVGAALGALPGLISGTKSRQSGGQGFLESLGGSVLDFEQFGRKDFFDAAMQAAPSLGGYAAGQYAQGQQQSALMDQAKTNQAQQLATWQAGAEVAPDFMGPEAPGQYRVGLPEPQQIPQMKTGAGNPGVNYQGMGIPGAGPAVGAQSGMGMPQRTRMGGQTPQIGRYTNPAGSRFYGGR